MKTSALYRGDRLLIGDVESAFSPVARMRGLLGRDRLGRDSALHIRPCACIHTMFMRFDIDIIFLAGDLTVVRIAENISPFRAVAGGRQARSAIELESGWFPWNELRVGDKVELR